MVTTTPASPDNQAIREMRDLLNESKKQTKYMLTMTGAVVILTLIQIFIAIFK